MGFDDFEPVVNFTTKCKHCGSVIPTGIVSISEHWNNCSGKGFKELLVKARMNKGQPLNETDLAELKHFLH